MVCMVHGHGVCGVESNMVVWGGVCSGVRMMVSGYRCRYHTCVSTCAIGSASGVVTTTLFT